MYPPTLKLDRPFGLRPNSGAFNLSSPMTESLTGLKKKYSYGNTMVIKLNPKEIRILNFD